MAVKDVELMAHLMRRAGFGASRERLEELTDQGYDSVVEQLLAAVDHPTRLSDNLIRRYHPEYSGMMGNQSPGGNWMYRMISTDAPLREKIGLMWHGMFATGYSKLARRREQAIRAGAQDQHLGELDPLEEEMFQDSLNELGIWGGTGCFAQPPDLSHQEDLALYKTLSKDDFMEKRPDRTRAPSSGQRNATHSILAPRSRASSRATSTSKPSPSIEKGG